MCQQVDSLGQAARSDVLDSRSFHRVFFPAVIDQTATPVDGAVNCLRSESGDQLVL
jgi:hypothetical protein